MRLFTLLLHAIVKIHVSQIFSISVILFKVWKWVQRFTSFVPNMSDTPSSGQCLHMLPMFAPILDKPVISLKGMQPLCEQDMGTRCIKDLRIFNLNQIIFGHLNVNSLRNKFDTQMDMVLGNIDIIFISETKIDNTFPSSQFMVDGLSKPIRLDRNDKCGGIMLFMREDIPCKQLKPVRMSNIEGIFIEIDLRKQKWLLFCGYNPHKINAPSFFQSVSKSINKLLSQYDNIIHQ